MTKYSDTIRPKKIEYRIDAYDVYQIEDPAHIFIRGTRKTSGESVYYIDDLVSELFDVKRIQKGLLEKDTDYVLKFTPKSSFSGMSIDKCDLICDGTVTDIRKEYSYYKKQDNSIINTNIAAHINNTAQLSQNHNIEDSSQGLITGHADIKGSFGIDISGMGHELVNMKVTCRETDISASSYIEPKNGFILASDGTSYIDTSQDSLGTLTIGGEGREMSCNSFSFTFDPVQDAVQQGAVTVTIIADGQVQKATYRQGTTISRSYPKRTYVEIIIQKLGQNPVSISGIRIASYDIKMSLSDGTSLT